jgi:hypothetical protein
VLLNLAKQWLKLAAEQERVRSSTLPPKKFRLDLMSRR